MTRCILHDYVRPSSLNAFLIPVEVTRSRVQLFNRLKWMWIVCKELKSFLLAPVFLLCTRKQGYLLLCVVRPVEEHAHSFCSDFYSIFFVLFQQLHTIHTGFHSEIQKSVADKKGSHKVSIADCFIKWKPKFLIYGEFCSNLTKAQDMVDELSRRNPMIAQNIEVYVLRNTNKTIRILILSRFRNTCNALLHFSGLPTES